MNLPCCLEHVELALDIIVDECEVAPVINNVDNSEKEKKTCEFCQNEANICCIEHRFSHNMWVTIVDMWISYVDNMFVRWGIRVNISIISIGKLKEKYLKQGIAEYLKRLSAYAKVEVIELPDEKAPENLSEAEMLIVKEKEGIRILDKISDDTHVIALAIEGKQKSSEEFAVSLDRLATYGKSKVAFVIGGSLGLSSEVMKRSNESLSFSKMTLPHQLMRLVLLEQVYRSFRINRGEPYHK